MQQDPRNTPAWFIGSDGIPMQHPMNTGGVREFQNPNVNVGSGGMNPMALMMGLKFLQGLAPKQGQGVQVAPPPPYQPIPFTGPLSGPSLAKR